jgi:hypothetical protein
MGEKANCDNLDTCGARMIDWMDVKFAVFVGTVTTLLKLIAFAKPEWHLNTTDALMAFLLTLGYIIGRARRQPEKLDEWGITTRLTMPAIATGFLLLGIAVLSLAASGFALTGNLTFEASYIPRMIDYIVGAFPQQFFMCSVGLVTLAKLRLFRGTWRLPLAVGLVFSLAHFWTPAHFPGTIIPIQMVVVFPAGFIVALYFLKFRNILPLTAVHAISYVLLHNWVELHL